MCPSKNWSQNLINSGKRLADCNPEKADRVVVFIRGLELLKDLEREEDFKKKVSKCVFGNENNKDKVDIFGRFSNSGEDALMLLRNPYGENDEKGSIKSRLIKMISSAINYIENPNNENDILNPKYFKDKSEGIEYNSRTYIKNRLKKQEDGKGLVNLLEKAKNNLESGIKPFCKEEFEVCKEFFQSKKEQAEEFGKDSGTSDGDINIIDFNIIDLKNEIKDLQKEVREIKTLVGRGSNKNDR